MDVLDTRIISDRNVADFTATGVALVNPWNPEG